MKKYLNTRAKIERKIAVWKRRKEDAEEAMSGLQLCEFNDFNRRRYEYEEAMRCASILFIEDLKEILEKFDDEFDAPFET